MTLNVQLPPELEAQLRKYAGAPDEMARYVLSAVEEKLATTGDSDGEPLPQSSDKWLTEFRRWLASHEPVPHEADDSRESIYAGRGEAVVDPWPGPAVP